MYKKSARTARTVGSVGSAGSKLFGTILCCTALVCIVIPVAPHFLRVLSPEHRVVIATANVSKPKRKLHKVSPSELQQLVSRIKKDTILIHFWNTWRSDGTKHVRELNSYTSAAHPSTAVVHICTDMSGLQQQKASRIIAEHLQISGPLLSIRSTASIFDLQNSEAALRFYQSLTGERPDHVSPSVLALNKHGQPIRFDGIARPDKKPDQTETHNNVSGPISGSRMPSEIPPNKLGGYEKSLGNDPEVTN